MFKSLGKLSQESFDQLKGIGQSGMKALGNVSQQAFNGLKNHLEQAPIGQLAQGNYQRVGEQFKEAMNPQELGMNFMPMGAIASAEKKVASKVAPKAVKFIRDKAGKYAGSESLNRSFANFSKLSQEKVPMLVDSALKAIDELRIGKSPGILGEALNRLGRLGVPNEILNLKSRESVAKQLEKILDNPIFKDEMNLRKKFQVNRLKKK